MDFKNIKVRSEQAVGFVQIDRVVDKNSLNIETSKEILQALTNFDQDSSIKCIAIEGNQKLFSLDQFCETSLRWPTTWEIDVVQKC